MERPKARAWGLIASATAVGFLVAGCSTNGAPIIGVPIVSSPSAQPAVSIDNAINQAIATELAQAIQTAVDGVPSLSQVELNALTSTRALSRYEAFSSLQSTGANQIAKREAMVNTLIANVRANKYLSGVDPSGRSLSASILSILDGVGGRLAALGAKIASDSLPDALRSDVNSVGPSTRVGGVYEPMTHLAMAGGDELYELNLLSTQQQLLAGEVAAVASTDPNHGQEVSRLNDLASAIVSARATINSALRAVMSLTASSYPGSKTTIANVRTALIQLRSPLGRISEANADANAIVDLLGNR